MGTSDWWIFPESETHGRPVFSVFRISEERKLPSPCGKDHVAFGTARLLQIFAAFIPQMRTVMQEICLFGQRSQAMPAFSRRFFASKLRLLGFGASDQRQDLPKDQFQLSAGRREAIGVHRRL
jgi:hypothetical protein